MAQCMDMERQDWDLRIEGIGLETAVQQWGARSKVSKPIDKEWRTTVGRTPGRVPAPPPDDQMDGASAEDSDDGSTADEDMEDEFAQVPDTPEEKNGRGGRGTMG